MQGSHNRELCDSVTSGLICSGIMLEIPQDTTRAVTNLLFSGTSTKFKNIRFIRKLKTASWLHTRPLKQVLTHNCMHLWWSANRTARCTAAITRSVEFHAYTPRVRSTLAQPRTPLCKQLRRRDSFSNIL